jgi:hypothetical protein
MRDVWFPAKESQSVVGRVAEVEKLHPAKSRAAQKPVYIIVPVMESKVASSHDISHQELKEHNRDQICARFPGAWEYYEKQKASKPKEEPQEIIFEGMPIAKADFIAREKISWLSMQGFNTVEQLAGMSDAQIQEMGQGARTWRKKARQLLQKPA